jgi:hypothetical protein
MKGMRSAYKISVQKAEVKRPLRKSRRGWEDNIKLDIICRM